MRKLYTLPVILPALLIMLQSCSKQSVNDMVAPLSPNIINTTIAPNGNYQLSLAAYSNVNIEKQASHYSVSKTELDPKTGHMFYQYTPAKDYRGTDEVVLSNKVFIGSSGGGRCNNNNNSRSSESGYATSYTTIRLNISN